MTIEPTLPGQLSVDGEPIVVGRNVQRVYGRGGVAVAAVRQATFAIAPDARIALVGPSGSGKSTLLNLIAGIDQPDSGTVAWPGLPRGIPLRPRLVGMAYQGPSLLPALDVLENVALPLQLDGMNRDAARAAAQAELERFGLADVAHKLPDEISGGQAQRAAVARAVVGPRLLVLADEPTGQQDSAGGARLLDRLFARVDELGAALVVATHDAAVAERFPIRWSMSDQRLITGEWLRSR